MDKYVNVWYEIIDKKPSIASYTACYTIASFFGIYPKEDVNIDGGEWVIKFYVPKPKGNKKTLITNEYLRSRGYFIGDLQKLPKTYISNLPVKKLKIKSVLTLFELFGIKTSGNLIYDHEKLDKLLKINGI